MLFCIFKFVLVSGSLLTSLMYIMGKLAGIGSVDVAVGNIDRWNVKSDIWLLSHKTWYVTYDIWHLTLDMKHMKFFSMPLLSLLPIFVLVLLSAHIERFSVYLMWDFICRFVNNDIFMIFFINKVQLQHLALFVILWHSVNMFLHQHIKLKIKSYHRVFLDLIRTTLHWYGSF